MPKHVKDALETALGNLPDGWETNVTSALKNLQPDQASALVAYIAQQAGITDREIKRCRTALLPSFSSAKWAEVAPLFGLPNSVRKLRFESFSPPPCMLPLSVHKAMFKEGWRAMDVYQERGEQGQDIARAKLLEPWLITLIALFEGRIIDLPESTVVPSQYSCGGAVAHEIVVLGRALFIVVELKQGMDRDSDLAQLFLELLSAAGENKQVNYAGLRVHGLLTDLTYFHLYSFDPTTGVFFKDDVFITNMSREIFCSDMIPVANKIFSILMYGYLESLEATVELSKGKDQTGLSSEKFFPMHQRIAKASLFAAMSAATGGSGRPRPSPWENGLALAKQAYEGFQKCALIGPVDQFEKGAAEALDLLSKSVGCLPRYSLYSGPACTQMTPAALDAMAEMKVKVWHEENLIKPSP